MEGPRQPAPEITWVRVSPEPIEAVALITRVAAPGAGAISLFLGTVRDHSAGRPGVTHLEYEAYPRVAEEKIAAIVAEARERWDLLSVAVEHRVGRLEVGEPSVGIAVSSAHRADGLEAARYLIDQLKERAPIWKKEHWAGGAEWVGAEGGD
ncbi:MAG: molybdenum cofactor biosynthesis protein MoaE [Acidimicrobiia bacterium]|nr:molybdenum cofactor biosynthesis protein MoaE [Acidimicrobiia bacterium]